jgi:hypothetical protein
LCTLATMQQGYFFWLQNTEGLPVVANTPTTGSPSVFCTRKKNPAMQALKV